MVDSFQIKAKVCLVGDSSVGKTSIIRRYVLDIFEDKYIATLGTKVSKKRIILKRDGKNIDLMFSIWDVLGQENFKKIHKVAFKGSRAAMLVCDFTREETLTNIPLWASKVKKVAGEIPKIILANKSDLTSQYAFSEADLQAFSSKLNTTFFKTSARFGDNIIKTFYQLGELIIEDIFKDED